VVPGGQTPVQAPATQAWFEHAVGSLQVPIAVQVSTPLPEHWVAPGLQTPMHAPAMQAWFEHGVTLVDQVPSEPQA
jgi:hypothetical protein